MLPAGPYQSIQSPVPDKALVFLFFLQENTRSLLAFCKLASRGGGPGQFETDFFVPASKVGGVFHIRVLLCSYGGEAGATAIAYIVPGASGASPTNIHREVTHGWH